jgi:hypothetical protein
MFMVSKFLSSYNLYFYIYYIFKQDVNMNEKWMNAQ